MPTKVLAPTRTHSRPAAPRHLRLVGGPPARAIRVVIAHERRLVRAGLRALLESEAGIVVVGEAANADEGMAVARRLNPDVLLMDVELDEDPSELIRTMKRATRRGCALNHRPALRLIEGEHQWNSGI